jgi:hypothetical protein
MFQLSRRVTAMDPTPAMLKDRVARLRKFSAHDGIDTIIALRAYSLSIC